MIYPDQFSDFGLEVWHCNRCHRVVRTYDANNETEAALMLQAHAELACVGDPFLDIATSVAS